MRSISAWGLGLALAACGARDEPPPRPLPELVRAVDLDPDPRVVALELTARVAQVEWLPGRPSEAWTYDGTVPGPLVDAAVGDTLVVRFHNALPAPTTLHWHGVRVPADMDGTEAMQHPVPPGGSFEYRFVLKDAGLYWFHPHVRSDEQVERGLYGVLRVGDPAGPALGRERVVVLDDVLLDGDGALVDPARLSHMEARTGREGNRVLANGAPNAFLEVTPGERVRLRLVNAAVARSFQLTLGGGRPLVLVGVDGGLLEAPRVLERLLLAPGQRADVLVDVDGAPGDAWTLSAEPSARGHHAGDDEAEAVLRLRLVEGQGTRAPLPGRLRTIAPLPAPDTLRRFVLGERMGMMSGPVFTLNGEAGPDVPPVATRVGAAEEWEYVNETTLDHPMHLHGYFFQVWDAAEATWERAWRDTVNVPAGARLRLRVHFDERPGRWMQHCHILTHAELGMVQAVDVAPE